MRFWRLKMWWYAYVMGRRVFYVEGRDDTFPKASEWRFICIVPRSLAVEAAQELREMIEQMPGEVTKEVVR